MELRVETPAGLRGEGAQRTLAAFGADAFVVVAYGRFLPPEALAMPALGVVNIHPSLLPRYRGPSPVATALLDGAAETGVTLMLLDEGMDTGPILAQSAPVRLKGDERAGELTARLFEIGAEMLPAALDGLADGSLTPGPQDDALATVTRLVDKDDGRIDWARPASETERAVRAYDPWPGAFTTWDGRTLKIVEARVARAEAAGTPGQVTVRDRRIFIATGSGTLEAVALQLEGKRTSSARDFLNGNPAIENAVLGG
jgi:methionyl-tRNA formyltransferase